MLDAIDHHQLNEWMAMERIEREDNTPSPHDDLAARAGENMRNARRRRRGSR